MLVKSSISKGKDIYRIRQQVHSVSIRSHSIIKNYTCQIEWVIITKTCKSITKQIYNVTKGCCIHLIISYISFVKTLPRFLKVILESHTISGERCIYMYICVYKVRVGEMKKEMYMVDMGKLGCLRSDWAGQIQIKKHSKNKLTECYRWVKWIPFNPLIINFHCRIPSPKSKFMSLCIIQ